MGGRGASAGTSGKIKNVEFEEIINSSKNSLTFDKGVTVIPDRYIPESGRKKDLENLINRYNMDDVVVRIYRDSKQEKDLNRMKELGFYIVKQYKPKQNPNSSVPPEDRFYMKRKRKK